MTRLTPELERARYELVADNDHMLRYRRRRVPTMAISAGLLLSTGSVWALATGLPAGQGAPWAAAAAGLVGVMLLTLVRRSDVLIVTVTSRPAGSAAIVAGYVNDRARIALRTWNPPVRPQLRAITPARRPSKTMQSSARSAPSHDL